MFRWILAACLTATPLLVAGKTIFKVQMPDGSVMFSDTVPAGGKVIEERESRNTPNVSTLPARPSATTPPAMKGRVATPNARLGAAIESIETAERDLALARQRLEAGREPLPGERRGLAGGGSRLLPEYEARIAGLEREVQLAEERLKKANDARSAARLQ